MRIDRNANLARVLIPALALAGFAWSAPAHAEWETVHGAPIEPGKSCPSPHERDPKLRNSDNRPLDIPAGFSNEIEIYGHGVDLSDKATLAGPGTAHLERGVGGGENGARGCGNIGSLVVKIKVPYGTPPGTATLNFGSESMPVRIITPSILRTEWSPQTMQGRSTLGNGQAPAQGAPGTPTGPITSTQGQGCGPGGGPGCNSSTGGVSTGGTGSGSGSLDDPPRLDDALGGCIDDIGGRATIAGATLTIDMPPGRGDAIEMPCLTRPVYFNVVMGEYRGDVGGFRAGMIQPYPDRGKAVIPPRYSGNTSGLTGPTALADPNRDFQSIRMTADLAKTFVGERRITLTPASGSGGASALTLVIRTDPGNGIRSVEGVPFGGPRTSARFEVRFDFAQSTRTGGEQVSWRLRPVGGSNPGNCFVATTGGLTVNGAIGRFTLEATERAGCIDASFALDIGPSRAGAAVFQAPFARTVTFPLPALSAPSLPPRVELPRRPN
jgi:hypothetical protein